MMTDILKSWGYGIKGRFVVDTTRRKRYPILHFRTCLNKYRKTYYSLIMTEGTKHGNLFYKRNNSMKVS
jgi:hypothetical protein